MAVSSSFRGRKTNLEMSKKCRARETSPERTKVWSKSPSQLNTDRKVPVIYYLSRNGQLDHPHFMEVPLSSTEGLYLKDVINRLNLLRGKGFASMYSWSSKRIYKNGFVWHDLAEGDLIYPAHGQEYVLKGSELLEVTLVRKSDVSGSSISKHPSPASRQSSDDSDSPAAMPKRNQSWSAMDLQEYKVVYKAESTGESSGRAASDASTQTDDKRRRRAAVREAEDERVENSVEESTELSRDEISPPPSDSSPETLESLLKADGRLLLHSRGGEVNLDRTANSESCGQVKGASVLIQLISCGSILFSRECGPTHGKEQGLSLISQCKERLARGCVSNRVEKEGGQAPIENPNCGERCKVEDKEHFSASLMETAKDEFPALKGSSS